MTNKMSVEFTESEARKNDKIPPRRPHSRYRRRRRNRRSPERTHRGPRTPHSAGASAEARRGRLRRQAAWRDRLARRRQFPELALSRSRETACGAAWGTALAPLLQPGRRREPYPVSAAEPRTHRNAPMLLVQ